MHACMHAAPSVKASRRVHPPCHMACMPRPHPSSKWLFQIPALQAADLLPCMHLCPLPCSVPAQYLLSTYSVPGPLLLPLCTRAVFPGIKMSGSIGIDLCELSVEGCIKASACAHISMARHPSSGTRHAWCSHKAQHAGTVHFWYTPRNSNILRGCCACALESAGQGAEPVHHRLMHQLMYRLHFCTQVSLALTEMCCGFSNVSALPHT